MTSWLRALLRLILGEYYIFRIYSCDLCLKNFQQKPLASDLKFSIFSYPNEKANEGYAGQNAFGFCCEEKGIKLSHCWVWYGERYRNNRNFWKLHADECKLIALETEPWARGRGTAPKLLHYVATQLSQKGFKRIYARVWHSNKSSIRAFEKAGWRYHALVVEFDFLGRRRLTFIK